MKVQRDQKFHVHERLECYTFTSSLSESPHEIFLTLASKARCGRVRTCPKRERSGNSRTVRLPGAAYNWGERSFFLLRRRRERESRAIFVL